MFNTISDQLPNLLDSFTSLPASAKPSEPGSSLPSRIYERTMKISSSIYMAATTNTCIKSLSDNMKTFIPTLLAATGASLLFDDKTMDFIIPTLAIGTTLFSDKITSPPAIAMLTSIAYEGVIKKKPNLIPKDVQLAVTFLLHSLYVYSYPALFTQLYSSFCVTDLVFKRCLDFDIMDKLQPSINEISKQITDTFNSSTAKSNDSDSDDEPSSTLSPSDSAVSQTPENVNHTQDIMARVRSAPSLSRQRSRPCATAPS